MTLVAEQQETPQKSRELERREPVQIARLEDVPGELYEDLLNRYERVLVYAGQLQQKVRSSERRLADIDRLRKERDRMAKLAAIEHDYVQLLEEALEEAGVLDTGKPPSHD